MQQWRTLPLTKGWPIAAPRKLCSLILGLLLLALEGNTASASDSALCDRAGADPDAGIPACTRLIEHPSPGINVPAAYNNRGVAKVRKGDLDSAVKDFTSALNQNPKFVDAFKNRGIARHMQEDYDAAIADFNRALRLNGNSPALYNARGAALFQKEEYDRAISDFDKAIFLDPNYKKAFINRGLAFRFKPQLDRAIADFDVYLRLAPNDPLGYVNRAAARMDKGDFDGAIADYSMVIHLEPTSWEGHAHRGEAKRLKVDLAGSLADHDKAIELKDDAKGGGTFSGAAIASQALSELSQTTIQETSWDTAKKISERREQEALRCAEGFSRVDGVCQPIPLPKLPEPAGTILETGYSLLKDIGGEERGYGLYSYAILVNNNDRSAKFLNDVFGDMSNTTPPIEETAAQPSQSNILYVTLSVRPERS